MGRSRAAVHHPMGPSQQAQQADVRRILQNTALQARLVVGPPNDQYEQEADRVADQVVGNYSSIGLAKHRPEASLIGRQHSPPVVTPWVQRQSTVEGTEGDELLQSKLIQRQDSDDQELLSIEGRGDEPEEETVQAKMIQPEAVDEEEGEVQAKAVEQKHTAATIGRVAAGAIKNKGPGSPMSAAVRRILETGLQQDLGSVRVHENAAERETASELGARAFTYRNHIWLGRGESQSDLHLMAHETTHVLQQGGVVRRKPTAISQLAPRVQGEWFGDSPQPDKAEQQPTDAATADTTEADSGAGQWLLEKLSAFATQMPGFHLLGVILGKNPITKAPVERNASNLIHGVLGLLPGGNILFENLQKAAAIEAAYAWFSEQIELLNLTWASIQASFRQAWDSLSAFDLLSPSTAFKKIWAVFNKPLLRIGTFAVAAARKVMQFIFEGALSLAGKAGEQVLEVLRRSQQAFWSIVDDPIGFLGNLLKAVGLGLRQFAENIGEHLKAGLFGWLFGTLTDAGIQMPEKLDLKGIVSLVLQILGLTYAKLRIRLVRLIGEKRVSMLEQAFEFLKVLLTEGIAGAWRMIVGYMGSLKEMVIGAIQDFVVTRIVITAITKLASMFNPVGAIIQAIITIYNTVMFFIERAKQIMALANAVFESVINIAIGKIKFAADYVEQSMARTIPVIISFLARLMGLGGIAQKIKDLITKIQAKVELAIDKVIGFIVSKAKKILGKDQPGKQTAAGETDNREDINGAPVSLPRSKAEERQHLDAAAGAVTKIAQQGEVKSSADLAHYFPKISKRYQLKEIGFRAAGAGKQNLHLAINPETDIEVHERLEGTGLDGIKTEVKWETASLGGVTVGKRMQADWLGPDHPQGTPPGSGVQNGLMDKLITDPSKSAEDKYIRGHLLNDNLGGEGKAHNLYPITADANKKHHDSIEDTVKRWVNTEKYWVAYRVEVEERGSDLSHGKNHPNNYVNAMFKCRAAIRGTDGKEYDTLSSNISSTFNTAGSAELKGNASQQRPAVSAEAKAMEAKLSTSKSDQSYVFHPGIYLAMKNQRNKMSAALTAVSGLGPASWESLQRFYGLLGTNKNRDLNADLSSADKRMFSLIMAHASEILANL